MTVEFITLMTNIQKFKMYIAAMLASVLLPVKPLVLIVGLMIFIDTFFGIYRAYKQKKPISSRALSAVVSKMFLYQGALLLFFFIDTYVLGDIIGQFTVVPLFLTKFVAAVLIGIEGLSICENVKLSTGFDFIKRTKEMVKRGKSIKDEIEDFADSSSDDSYNEPPLNG